MLRKGVNLHTTSGTAFFQVKQGVCYVTTDPVNNCVAAMFRSLYLHYFRVGLSSLLGKELFTENKTRPKVPREINVQHTSQKKS